ncbi:rhomboid family intramembrane serine protease [Candidatus Bathyarchaeota archaeon]|nr:rhomboid family intramembrane serine protease [Candidatus Bathyarchaeota archaeon]
MRRINIVILLCILSSVFFWFLSPNESEAFFSYFVFSGDNLLQGKVWTTITALFLHADPLHLVGNMLFLYVFGNTLEEEIGPKKTLAAFFSGGILSFLLSVFFYSPQTSMIGASAAIFTLTSIVMLVKPLRFSILFLLPQGLVAILYFMYNIVAVYYGTQGNVAFISHIIGFIIGIPLGMAWSREWKKNLLITLGLLVLFYVLQILLQQLL